MTHTKHQPGFYGLGQLRLWLFLVGAVLVGTVFAADEATYVLINNQKVPMTIDESSVAVIGGDSKPVAALRAALSAQGVSAAETASNPRYSIVSGEAKGLTASKVSTMATQGKNSNVTPIILVGSNQRVSTGEIVVEFKAATTLDEAGAFGQANGLTVLRQVIESDRFFIYSLANPFDILKVCAALADEASISSAYPHVFYTGMAPTGRIKVNDPLFQRQWHLRNTNQTGGAEGEDANIRSIWNLFTGKGVEVAVVDSYLQRDHEDLRGKIAFKDSRDYSVSNYNYLKGDLVSGSYHGTAVAGVIAATDGNKKGGIGVAPNATLASRRVFYGDSFIATEEEIRDSQIFKLQQTDIINNSWAYFLGWESPFVIESLVQDAFFRGVRDGRGGLGNIFLFAAGNQYGLDDNTNFAGYTNSPYVITVGASNHHGSHCSYSTEGANILVNAPSGDTNTAGIVTTDLMDTDGGAAGNYLTDFDGTSAATPIVSGVVALMLEANPNLTWQEVRQILLTTAQHNAIDDGSWELIGENAVPVKFPYSHLHGFGRVDADAAARTAAEFISEGPRIASSVTKIERPSDGYSGWLVPRGGVLERTLDFQGEENLFIEDIKVTLTLYALDWATTPLPYPTLHWRCFRVSLISPSGTVSVLAPEERGDSTRLLSENVDIINYGFHTVRHWGEPLNAGDFAGEGESGGGVWTLRIESLKPWTDGVFFYGGPAGGLTYWEMTATGRPDVDFGGYGDGLPDDWELKFFGSNALLDEITPEADPNEDGKTNYEHFLDGTSPVNRTTVVYNLTERTVLEGDSTSTRQNRRGILVNDRNNSGLYSVLSYKDPNGINYFHEEQWGQMADWSSDSGGAAVLKFVAAGLRREDELISAVDYFDTPVGDTGGDNTADVFQTRILLGHNVRSAAEFGITRDVVARSLRGSVVKRLKTEGSPSEPLFGNGILTARVNRKETYDANKNNVLASRIVSEYKTALVDAGYIERLLTLSIDTPSINEGTSGSAVATVTMTTTNNNPVNLQGVTVYLTSHNPDEVTVPPSVVIPANLSTATFAVSLHTIDNDALGQSSTFADREIKFRATAIDRSPAVQTINVIETDEMP